MTDGDERYTKPRRKTGFLILVSGARPEVLDRCPSERIKFQSLGWAILITCGMATVSMWFALTSAMGFSPVLSFPVAILWGLIIMGIDRWLVTSMPLDGRRKFLIAAPRVALAVLLGSLISTPIVLRIFESEINNQISVIKENSEAAFLSSQQHSSIAARVTQWQNTVNNLQQVIDSHGQKAINPASDPIVQGLTTQLNNERSVAASDYHAWQCQLYGGCGAPKGSGPLAAASHQRYLNDESQISTLTQGIQTREQQLQATDVNSQASRLQQATSALPAAQAQLSAAQGEENSLTNNFQNTNSATNGLLIRLKALDQLSAGSSTLQAARILLFLLFLVIEVLPVTVKLLQRPGNYEKIMLREIDQELARADWDLRGSFQPAGFQPAGFRGTGDPRPSSLDDSPADWHARSPQRDQREAELAAVWEQHTRAAPLNDWEDRADTAYLDEETTGPHRLDDILRGMTDTRSTSGYEERQGGIERRYGEDEL